ncbi:MAG TPA: iron-containing alcohol dehydrogenase [Candidatus Dormibacteraeota bacterium]
MESPRVLFGRGAIAQVGAEAEKLGDRILLICTPSLEASEAAGRIRKSLGPRLVGEFDRVRPHVPAETVAAATRLAAEHRPDVVIALGGGSAIGLGKNVVISPAPVYGGGGRGRGEGREGGLIAIPTTYAGSEMTSVYGVRDPDKGVKHVRRDPSALPKVAIYDPDLFLDLPADVTAATAMNALAHCVEAVYARDVDPSVPPVALEGIRHIVRALPVTVANGHDLEAREELLRGAQLGATSIANATMGLHHGLCHVLGGRTGIAHGVLNGIMLSHVMRYNADAVPEAMGEIADAMDAGSRIKDAEAGARFVAALLESLPIPRRLSETGMRPELLDVVAVDAAANATVRANPKPAGAREIRELLELAW